MVAGLTLGGCDSGQTGSASCAAPQACECRLVVGKHLAMVTVVELSTQTTSVRIEEVLNPDDIIGADDVHSTLTGNVRATTTSSCVTSNGGPQVGDSALAVLMVSTTYLETGFGVHQLQGVTLLPWTDPLQLGEGPPTELSDLVDLTRSEACDERFPPPPAMPCNDVDETGGCNLSATSHTGSARGALIMIGSMLLLLARRKGRQQS